VPHSQNRLLASLSSEDSALILPHLEKVRVEQHHVLFDAGSEVHSSYFPLTAIVSLVMASRMARLSKRRWSDPTVSYRLRPLSTAKSP
jgi:hypothetical protein